MRTKTLLLTAVLGAAGVVSSMAQVYSVNAVGYVNLDLPMGFSLIANPLNNGDNKLSTLIPTAPDGTTIFKFDGTGFDSDAPLFVEGFGWFQSSHDVNTYTLNPGEGVFISLPAATKVTFVGEVPQGTLTTAVPAGFSIRASQVPQAGLLTTDLGFSGVEGDTVYKWIRASQMYDANTPQFFEGVGWFPEEPSVGVGESFFVLRTGAAGNWTRTFSVNE
jgi:hypothetical protein